MKAICIPKLENFLPLGQDRIQLGKLPFQAEIGPWRRVESEDKPHPLHINSTIIGGQEFIPTRLYGPGEKAVKNSEIPAMRRIEIEVAMLDSHGTTHPLASSLS